MNMPMPPTLIIDANYIGHQARHTLGHLSLDDVPTGVLYGFLTRVLTLGFEFETNDMLFCWDSRKSYRKKRFAGYKARREKDRSLEEQAEIDLAYRQFVLLRKKILPQIGFANNFLQPGIEADDLMVRIVMDNPIATFVIITSDEDLFQALQYPNVEIYNPRKRSLMSAKRFRRRYGIKPKDWVKVKYVAGCTSDCIPGIKGIGEKTALRWLRGELTSSKSLTKIESGLRKAKRKYKRLVELPYPKTRSVTIKPNEFSDKDLKKVCKKYGMRSFLKHSAWQQWMDLFANNLELE